MITIFKVIIAGLVLGLVMILGAIPLILDTNCEKYVRMLKAVTEMFDEYTFK